MTTESNILSPTCLLTVNFPWGFLVEARPGVRLSLEQTVLLPAFLYQLEREKSCTWDILLITVFDILMAVRVCRDFC